MDNQPNAILQYKDHHSVTWMETQARVLCPDPHAHCLCTPAGKHATLCLQPAAQQHTSLSASMPQTQTCQLSAVAAAAHCMLSSKVVLHPTLSCCF